MTETDDQFDDEIRANIRPLKIRLLHASMEVLLSFVFAGGLFLEVTRWVCLDNHQCNDFGGIAYMVFGLFVTMIAWSVFLSMCRRFRDRPVARKRLDIGISVVTAGLWLSYLLS